MLSHEVAMPALLSPSPVTGKCFLQRQKCPGEMKKWGEGAGGPWGLDTAAMARGGPRVPGHFCPLCDVPGHLLTWTFYKQEPQ